MKTFSLIVPTRERVASLNQYLESIINTVKNPKRIFVRVIYDDDDEQTKNFSLNVKQYPFKIYWHKRGRSDFINEDYYNFGAKQCSSEDSDYLFINADDIRFLIKDWDSIIETKMEEFCKDKPDRLVGIGIKDDTPKPNRRLPDFPCFPLVTKESLKHFGFVLNKFVPNWGADYLFYLLYNETDRYLSIDDTIYMQHLGVHTNTLPRDKTALHLKDVYNTLRCNQVNNIDYNRQHIIPKQIEEFREYLKGIS